MQQLCLWLFTLAVNWRVNGSSKGRAAYKVRIMLNTRAKIPGKILITLTTLRMTMASWIKMSLRMTMALTVSQGATNHSVIRTFACG